MDLRLVFERRPSVVAYMLRGFLARRRMGAFGGFPPVRAVWRRQRVDPGQLAEFLALTGLRAEPELPSLFPHVVGFPLQMVILTHPAFPIPIWKVLQTRNHLQQHLPIPRDAELEFEASVTDQRVLERGAEVDLHTAVRWRDEVVWESLNTFYYRGRFGTAGEASPQARAPEVGETAIAQWRTGSGMGRRFAALTGDYNGIHYWQWYARLLGFRQAFHRPQLVLGQCLARLPAPDPTRPQRLEAWLKGPVFYGADVRLRATEQEQGLAFALDAEGDARPAILGRWRTASTRRAAPSA